MITAFETWLTQHRARVSGKSPLGEALKYIAKYWDGLILYLSDGRIEMGSNAAERTIRPISLNRKNARTTLPTPAMSQLDTRINRQVLRLGLMTACFELGAATFTAFGRDSLAVFRWISVIRTDSRPGSAAFVEDQPVHVVGEIGQSQFGLGAGEADRPDEQAVAVLLVGEDMLDPGADGGFRRIGPCGRLRCCRY
jgi:hypothetical protein